MSSPQLLTCVQFCNLTPFTPIVPILSYYKTLPHSVICLARNPILSNFTAFIFLIVTTTPEFIVSALVHAWKLSNDCALLAP